MLNCKEDELLIFANKILIYFQSIMISMRVSYSFNERAINQKFCNRSNVSPSKNFMLIKCSASYLPYIGIIVSNAMSIALKNCLDSCGFSSSTEFFSFQFGIWANHLICYSFIESQNHLEKVTSVHDSLDEVNSLHAFLMI